MKNIFIDHINVWNNMSHLGVFNVFIYDVYLNTSVDYLLCISLINILIDDYIVILSSLFQPNMISIFFANNMKF